jgi:uncharacterized membrane protein YozB (DUF420 family)
MGTLQDAVQNVIAFFFICAGLQAVFTGQVTQRSRFLLGKLIAAYFLKTFPALYGGPRLKNTAF